MDIHIVHTIYILYYRPSYFKELQFCKGPFHSDVSMYVSTIVFVELILATEIIKICRMFALF